MAVGDEGVAILLLLLPPMGMSGVPLALFIPGGTTAPPVGLLLLPPLLLLFTGPLPLVGAARGQSDEVNVGLF